MMGDDRRKLLCSKLELPDEIWLKIFRQHLETYSLFHSVFNYRCVSKSWLSLLSNPCLVKGLHLPLHPQFNLVFVYYFSLFLNRPRYDFKLITYPGGDQNNYTSFYIPRDILFMVCLASSNGLILGHDDYLYYVFNPQTGESVTLPMPSLKFSLPHWSVGNPQDYSLSYAFITSCSCSCSSSSSLVTTTCTTKYTVVLIPNDKKSTTNTHEIDIFSSDVGEWKTYQLSCQKQSNLQTFMLPSSRVVALNGTLYWIESQGKKIVMLDLNNKNNNNNNNDNVDRIECQVIDLPIISVGTTSSKFTYHLGKSEGFICYGIIGEEGLLNVWKLQWGEENKSDSGRGCTTWCLIHKDIELQINKPSMRLSFSPVDLDVVILECCGSIHTYNIRSRNPISFSYPPPRSSEWFKRIKISLTETPELFFYAPQPTEVPPPTWLEPVLYS